MPKTYSVKEAAAILGFSTNTIYTYLNDRKLKGIRVGKGKFRIPQSEIDRMTGSTQPTSVIVPQVEATEQRVFEPFVVKRPVENNVLSLYDWLIGLGSMILGGSMFVYTAALDHMVQPQFVFWYGIVRFLLILFGFGYIVSKFLVRISPLWPVIYKVSLFGIYGWFFGLSLVAQDTKGAVIGLIPAVIILLELFVTQSFSSLVTFAILLIAFVNTALVAFFPIQLTQLLSSFGIVGPLGLWGNIAIVLVPYIVYIGLIVTYRSTSRLYYVIVLFCSLTCMVGGYHTGVNLFWRQGLSFLFVGLVLFAHICFETASMRAVKKPWLSLFTFGSLAILFLGVIASLKIFELTMYEYANRELQVKVENGKLYLETIFEYAQRMFHIHTSDEVVVRAIARKDREVLTEQAKMLFEQFPHVYRVVILDKEGTEVANYPRDVALEGKNFAYRKYFQDVMVSKSAIFSDAIETSGTIRKTTFVKASPIMQGDDVVGVFVGAFDLEAIGNKLQSFAADESGEYFGVLDRQGVRLINPNTASIGTSITKEELKKFDTISYWKTHLDTRLNPQGKLVFATYRTTDVAHLNISAVEPVEENLRTKLIARLVVTVVFVYGFIAILVAWYISYKEYGNTIRRNS